MCKRNLFGQRWLLSVVGLLFVMTAYAAPAEAFEIKLGDETSLAVDVELSYSGAWRVKDQDEKLLANINGDDGNRSFDKGDMINNRFTSTIDLDLKHKNVGIFVRPRAYFDFAYDGDNANNSATNNNGPQFGGPLSSSDEFTDDTKDLHRDKVEILDAFAYGDFDLGERALTLRVGRQVVSWGESMFIPNSISSAQSPVDLTATNVPGVALKEIFLPVGQVFAQVDLFKNLTLAGYYQWEWDKTRLDEQGSYFSTADFIDDAGRRILADASLDAAIDRVSDDDPSDSGQWGVALRYLAEGLNDTEFGLYYINYHDKTPQVTGQLGGGTPSATAQALGGDWGNLPVPTPGGPFPLSVLDPTTAAMLNGADYSSYFLRYAEDIHLYGASFSSVIGTTNVSGEVSYRQDLPLQVVAGPPLFSGYVSGEALQAQISAIHIFGGSPIWDNLTVMAEFGANRVYGFSDATLVNDRSAWGGTVSASFDYLGVLSGLDLTVPLTYKVNPGGVSSVPGTFSEDADSVALGLDFLYLNNYKIGVKYTKFLNSASDNSKADRDFLALNLKYTF